MPRPSRNSRHPPLQKTQGWGNLLLGGMEIGWASPRIKKIGGATPPGVVYLRGAGVEALAETNGSGTLLNEYVLLNGQRIARRDANTGAVHYYVADHLGSASLITDASGTVQKEADYYPYGGEIAVSGTDANHYKFTGKERDETGLDEFGARYYSSAMGRFMTADWGAIPMAVPYAVLGNPQTLNLYSYVENNPATSTDPDGHVPPDGLYHGDPFGGGGSSADFSLVELSFPQAKPQMLDVSWLIPGAQGTAQNACQTGSCNVKTVSDTGPTGTPNPLGLGAVERDVTYQAVDPSGKSVKGAEISLHETPLPGKEGGDAKNYTYAANGSSNSQKGEEPAHRAGQFNDVISTGAKGPAGFKQTYTVEGKPANIIWPTKNGPVVAPSQKVLIRPDKVIILPEVNQ